MSSIFCKPFFASLAILLFGYFVIKLFKYCL
nr:MAG TPA: hypothetical protein [Caudoviricetes sp.]